LLKINKVVSFLNYFQCFITEWNGRAMSAQPFQWLPRLEGRDAEEWGGSFEAVRSCMATEGEKIEGRRKREEGREEEEEALGTRYVRLIVKASFRRFSIQFFCQ